MTIKKLKKEEIRLEQQLVELLEQGAKRGISDKVLTALEAREMKVREELAEIKSQLKEQIEEIEKILVGTATI